MSETNMCIDGTDESESREKLRAVLVQLDDPVRGRCALCKNLATLPFCLEFLDSKDNVVLWGDVCEECADKTRGEKFHEDYHKPSKRVMGEILSRSNLSSIFFATYQYDLVKKAWVVYSSVLLAPFHPKGFGIKVTHFFCHFLEDPTFG